MTLKQFLDLKVLRDNVQVLEFIPDAIGLGTSTKLCECVRSYSIVTSQMLLKVGLDVKYLDYEVTEIWGTKHKFKVGIVIQKIK